MVVGNSYWLLDLSYCHYKIKTDKTVAVAFDILEVSWHFSESIKQNILIRIRRQNKISNILLTRMPLNCL